MRYLRFGERNFTTIIHILMNNSFGIYRSVIIYCLVPRIFHFKDSALLAVYGRYVYTSFGAIGAYQKRALRSELNPFNSKHKFEEIKVENL